ncbi:hypothetical protein ACWD3I_25115 [Streptomyces sp. NPDC002817]|uniref:hypothetical protein n=1 Tax=Streptomyces sp. NPDC088357 TaxID=3154655 RepID=UPI003439FD3B
MSRTAYSPTSAHPHRWCRKLHRATAVLVALGLVLAMTFGSLPLSLLVGMTLAALLAVVLVTAGTDLRGLNRQHAHSAPLVTRPGWAAAAVVADMAGLFLAVRFVLNFSAYQTDLNWTAATGFTAVAAGAAWAALYTVLHVKAVAPAQDRDAA